MSESVIALSRFRAELTRSLTRRGRKLLESDKLAEDVAELTPLETYFVVKELGSDTALPILKHFTDAQFKTLIDIEGWDGAEPQFEDIDAWLSVYSAVGPDDLATAFLRLDPELQTLMLRAMLVIWDRNLDEIPEPRKNARRKDTGDSFFVVEARDAKNWEVDPFALVDALYRHDVGEGTRQLVAARSEQDTFLAEEAYRFRAGRLEDWGFPERERAMRLFAPPERGEPDFARSAPKVFTSVPALYAAPLTEGSLFIRALNLIDDVEMIRVVQEELVFLVNSALVAYGGALRDVGHVVSITERVRDGVSLGLETLLREVESSEKPAAARALIEKRRLESLFRTGHFELEKLARNARSLAEDPVIQHWMNREDAEGDDYKIEKADRAFLRALCGKPPLYAGFDRVHPTSARMVSTADELEAVSQRLDQLAEAHR